MSFDPDTYLAEKAAPLDLDEYIREKQIANMAAKMGTGEAIARGATRGLGDRILARASALAEQQGRPVDAFHSMDAVINRPVDLAQFETDRARMLQERRMAGVAAERAHPTAYMAGEFAPALASMAIPGAGTVKGAAGIGGALGLIGSESDDPSKVAQETAASAALSGAGATALQLLGRGAGAIGERLLPKAEALRDSIMGKIADRSASAAEATAKAAQGSSGAARANASRTVERLGMRGGLPEAELAANEAALATPEAQQLASELAARARGELPERLAHMQGAESLASQASADAAAARSPAAVAAMEQQMRRETASRLLKRYLLPAAGGYVVGEMTGGHGGAGATAGLLFRPGARAILRGVSSPAYTAPLSRALVTGAEGLAGMSGETASRLAPMLAEEAEPKLIDLLRALRERRSAQLAQNESETE